MTSPGDIVIGTPAGRRPCVRVRLPGLRAFEEGLAGSNPFSSATFQALTELPHLPVSSTAALTEASLAALSRPSRGPTGRLGLETAADHLEFLTCRGPRLAGLPEPEEAGRIRERLAQIRTGLLSPGADLASRRMLLRGLFETEAAGCGAESFGAVASLPDLVSWMQSMDTPAARFLRAVWAQAPSDLRCRPEDLLWPGGAFRSAAEQLGRSEGMPFEPDAFSEPAVRELTGCWPGSLRARIVARLAELARLVRGTPPSQPPVRSGSPEPCTGLSLVQSPRGPMLCRVQADSRRGVILRADLRVPPEGNFAPDGPVQKMLSQIGPCAGKEFERQARWVLAAFDTCLPFRFETGMQAA